jgi:hypothetical protein
VTVQKHVRASFVCAKKRNAHVHATRLPLPPPRQLAALRGDLDPKPWEQNTERAPGVLLQSLVSFPADYSFSVVGADAGGCPKGEHREFVEFVLATGEAPEGGGGVCLVDH